MKSISFLTSFFASCLLQASVASSAFAGHGFLPAPWVPGPRTGPEAEISLIHDIDLLVDARKHHPRVLFFGDSITANWMTNGLQAWNQYFAPLNSYDIGIPGDNTQALLWRMQHGSLDGLEPESVVLMIGTNNIELETVIDTVHGISAVIDALKMHLPNSEILLLGVLPRSPGPAYQPLRQKIREVNACLALKHWPHVHFVDIGDSLLQKDGAISAELLPDGVHPSAAGYSKLAPLIVAGLNQLHSHQKPRQKATK